MAIMAALLLGAILFAIRMVRPHLVRAGVIKNNKETSRMDVRHLGDALKGAFLSVVSYLGFGAMLWFFQSKSSDPSAHEWLIDPWVQTWPLLGIFMSLWAIPNLVKAGTWHNNAKVWCPTAIFTPISFIAMVVWYVRLVVIGSQ